ncbi:hypothetical protein UFOVP1351_8 [uncultured Caudovirales phage]|uniref:Uncharacterized protein n=1 Tax=uncultured Caudovirales phage TaxID=2100421 RepID=A0A6J5RQY1_9CAUD|nr:hypothetical protein UFOVP1351_8 [uncultured Caudovirales phage]
MYRYAGEGWDLRNIACAILSDDGTQTANLNTEAVAVIAERLKAHVTGSKRIDGDAWLARELKAEKRLAKRQSTRATGSSASDRALSSSRSKRKATV